MNPWVVGWIASDGHNAGDYWLISQNIDDVDALCLIKEIYPDMSTSISFETNNRYGTKPIVTIKRRCISDCEELIRYGIPTGDKTFSLTFPINVSDDFLWEYLRGFFEGDGSLSIEDYRYPKYGITYSKLWCDGCKEWIGKFGINSCVSKDGENAYSLNVHSIEGVRRLIEGMYYQDRYYKLCRKFSIAMKIITLLDYWKEKKNKNIIKQKLEKDIISAINTGMSVDNISEKVSGSVYTVSKIRKSLGLIGHKSNLKIEEIQDKLKQGAGRESLVKIGYGKKIVYKAFKLLYGDPRLLREKRDEEIRAMILKGDTISDITHKLKCGEAKVIKEKRYLFSLGYDIRLNKVRGQGD